VILVTARLESPDQIAIDQRGPNHNPCFIAGQQITFDADGTERVETTRSGRTHLGRVQPSREINWSSSSTGDRANQFSVTFRPIDNGRALEVTRRVYVEGLSYPVEVRSVYDKPPTSRALISIAKTKRILPIRRQVRTAIFIVRDGEEIVGTLDDHCPPET